MFDGQKTWRKTLQKRAAAFADQRYDLSRCSAAQSNPIPGWTCYSRSPTCAHSHHPPKSRRTYFGGACLKTVRGHVMQVQDLVNEERCIDSCPIFSRAWSLVIWPSADQSKPGSLRLVTLRRMRDISANMRGAGQGIKQIRKKGAGDSGRKKKIMLVQLCLLCCRHS